MTIADIFGSTAADVFSKTPLHALTTAGDVLVKTDDAATPASFGRLPGSYEHFIEKARGALTTATPCPGNTSTPNGGGPYHYPSVVGTFPDHALVGCDGCAKTWHVPFSINDDNEIVPGEPSERVAKYVDPNGDDDDDDEDEEVADDDESEDQSDEDDAEEAAAE